MNGSHRWARYILVFPAIIYLTASNMPMKGMHSKGHCLGGQGKEDRLTPQRHFWCPDFLGWWLFLQALVSWRAWLAIPEMDTVRRLHWGLTRARGIHSSGARHQGNLAAPVFSSSSRFRLTSSWEQVFRLFTFSLDFLKLYQQVSEYHLPSLSSRFLANFPGLSMGDKYPPFWPGENVSYFLAITC